MKVVVRCRPLNEKETKDGHERYVILCEILHFYQTLLRLRFDNEKQAIVIFDNENQTTTETTILLSLGEWPVLNFCVNLSSFASKIFKILCSI